MGLNIARLPDGHLAMIHSLSTFFLLSFGKRFDSKKGSVFQVFRSEYYPILAESVLPQTGSHICKSTFRYCTLPYTM
jgi:hypothetical protein